MTPSPLWSSLACGALLLGALGARAAAAPTQTSQRPNFILILTDDQGWTGTSVQLHPELAESRSDYYQTPNLQRLASQGMRFSSAYSSGPNCSPTRCSIQTGLGPARTGMTDLFFRHGEQALGPLITARNVVTLDAERVTLPEALKQFDASYRTAHFGKWHLGSGGPGQHGFDVHDGSTVNQNGNARVPDDPKRIFTVTERSLAFLREQAASEQPFFLQVSYFAVHLGTEALAETIARYEALPRGERHEVAAFAAMTEDLDTGVGMLLDELERLGLAQNTYVIYFSDNGAHVAPEVTNNRPLRKGKTSLWEGGIRVPLVVRGPGIEAGSRSAARVVGHDLFPTLCDLAGAKAALPEDLDGGSFKDLLLAGGEGTVARHDEFLVFHFPHYQIPKGTTPQSAIMRGPYKLLKFWEDGSHELFAIDSDFGETRDLSGEQPQLANELDALLVNYLREVEAPMPTPNPAWDAEQQAEFDRVFDQGAE